MTAQEMIDQAHTTAEGMCNGRVETMFWESELLRDIIRHLCDPEQHPYPMTSPEL